MRAPTAAAALAAALAASTGAASSSAAAPPAPGNWTLHLLDDRFPEARCLDGSKGGFWVQHGVGSNANKWVIHHQGGGWCISLADCVARSGTFLGSSTSWVPNTCCQADGGDNGMLSSDPSVNALADWSKVFIGYCDGGSYSGHVDAPVVVNTTTGAAAPGAAPGTAGTSTLYFRGKDIMDGVYASLLTDHGMSNATDIVVKGCSAGGLSVYLHADYLASKMPSTARYVAAPGAGFFLDYPAFGGGYAYRKNYQNVAAMQNVTAAGSLNIRCLAAYASPAEQWKCFTAPYSLRYIETPLFISNSLTDSWQAYNIMDLGCVPTTAGSCSPAQWAYLNGFRDAVITNLTNAGFFAPAGKNGAFLQTCFVHVVEDVDVSWNRTLVGGQTQEETFLAWYGGGANGKSVAVIDAAWPAGKVGNPTCYSAADYKRGWRGGSVKPAASEGSAMGPGHLRRSHRAAGDHA